MTDRPHCTAYFAISLDGFIADAEGGVGWLEAPTAGLKNDTSFADFMGQIDAMIMGRNTFQQVLTFGEWPYTKPVFVASNSLKAVPDSLHDKATLTSGSPTELLQQMADLGHTRIYVDGGATVQGFLAADLINRLVMTIIPTMLGLGIRIFGTLAAPLDWALQSSRTIGNGLVELTYDRISA